MIVVHNLGQEAGSPTTTEHVRTQLSVFPGWSKKIELIPGSPRHRAAQEIESTLETFAPQIPRMVGVA